MQNSVERFLEHYRKKYSKNQKVFAVLVMLSLLVITAVFWRLRIHGIALAGEAFCGQTEHVHTQECAESDIACEQKEHVHTAMCYSDKTADLETAEDWEATLPKQLTGNWQENLIAVAQSQAGYQESTKNYILAEDGERKAGYTRYGAWYGNAYGDWNTMFISFCLNYAEIQEEAIPYEAGCHVWNVELEELGLYEKAETYIPSAGDILFLNENEDKSKTANRAGIIIEVEEKENEQIVLHTIEGDSSDCVEEKVYDITDPFIVGYGNLSKAREKYELLMNPKDEGNVPESVPYELNGNVAVNTAEAFRQAFTSGNASKIIQLQSDMTVSGTINLAEITEIGLDLNGKKLTVSGGGSLFTVPANTTLTILDSQSTAGVKTFPGGNNYGNLGTYTQTTLTYYVTESTVIDSARGITQERLVKYEVPVKGRILAGDATLLNMTGGTVNLTSGMLCEGTNRAVNLTSGTLNLSGGYIYGFTKTGEINTGDANFGGAILATGGNIQLSGTVLAANKALNGGAIYAKGSTRIDVTGVIDTAGGIVTGNESTRQARSNGNGGQVWEDHKEDSGYRCGGGGIYTDGTVVITMSGGYITNNVAKDEGYFDGGGGVCLNGSSNMTLNAGFITGNKAQGGGGVRTDFNRKTNFTMNNGFVAGNVATTAEGGGVTIDRGGAGYFYGGYITNNQILNTVHWGGGGLFCADGSDMYLKKALITENSAGGFGGGVAGCPTGKIYLYVDEGCAIYNNEDIVDGEIHYVDGGSKDDIDTEYCDAFFQAHGHKDYFCALNSTVTGTMLGGNPALWEGSADGTAVSLDENDIQTAMRVMGLESHPSDNAILAAQGAAAVYITGNYSYTHGGGILSNGNLIIGNPTNIEVPARLGLKGTKALVNNPEQNQDLSKYGFKFQVLDKNEQVISEAVCDKDGNIIFNTIDLTAEGEFVYTIREVVENPNPGITYDTSEYRLTVKVEKQVTSLNGDEFTKTAYLITATKLEKSDGNNGWKLISNATYGIDSLKGKDNLALQLTGSTPTFVNRMADVSKITVVKKWDGDVVGTEYVTVDLYQDGKVYKTVRLSKDNKWTYTWTDLPAGHFYEVIEQEVPGFTASYETTDSLGEEKNYWVPAQSLEAGQKYMIVNEEGDQALYISAGHQNNGFDANDRQEVIQNAGLLVSGNNTYTTWYDINGIDERCVFVAEEATKNGNKGIVLKNEGASANTWLLIQNANGNYLKSTSGIAYASFMEYKNGMLIGQENYNWNPNNLRTVIYSDNKFNTSTSPNQAAKIYTLASGRTSDGSIITITNTPKEEYELPNTGGTGTVPYMLIGLLLMAGSMIKLIREKRS